MIISILNKIIFLLLHGGHGDREWYASGHGMDPHYSREGIQDLRKMYFKNRGGQIE